MRDLMKTFDFDDQPVRAFLRDGEPWMVASDVCRVLGLANSSQVVARLDDDEKGVHIMDTLGGPQEVRIISESGLWALVFTSSKPEAKRFRKWVTSEVLPALRKTGTYTDPLFMDAAPERQPIDYMARQDVSNWLSMVREARLLRGPAAAVRMWKQSPLPPLETSQAAENTEEPDIFCQFIDACCHVSGDRSDAVTSADLCAAFHRWQREQGQPPQPDRTVSVRFKVMSRTWRCPRTKQRFTARETGRFNGYVGIALV